VSIKLLSILFDGEIVLRAIHGRDLTRKPQHRLANRALYTCSSLRGVA